LMEGTEIVQFSAGRA